MSDDYREIPSTKIAMRGKMLVAWLAEATPPVLWRWLASDVSGGFGLRQADGKMDLVRYDGGVTPQTVATFESVQSAEQAMAGLSRAVLAYRSPWKKAVVWSLAALALLLFVLGNNPVGEKLIAISEIKALSLLSGSKTAATATTAASPAAVAPAAQPAAPRPAGPAIGAPVDVDSFYH